MNISFLTSGHEPFDDRIFYHMARSLADHNHNVLIISSKADLVKVVDGIGLNCFAGDNMAKRDKINKFIELLSDFEPDVIVCSEPLTVLTAKRYRSQSGKKLRIVYDITEWYPSKKNLSSHNYLYKWFIFIKLALFNLWVTRYTDSFIFGEFYKSRPYRLFFPRKPFVNISYFPDIKYISNCKPSLSKDTLRLSYSGKISLEKGFGNLISLINTLIKTNKQLHIKLKIIGWYMNDKDRSDCEQLLDSLSTRISIQRIEKQSLINYIDQIKETDIFLDLRLDDYENQHCLPIKLFYYMALGRPVIYSDLKAIRKALDTEKFGFLVKPNDYKTIEWIIQNYINNNDFYYHHCINARKLSETKFNWQVIEHDFLKFLSR